MCVCVFGTHLVDRNSGQDGDVFSMVSVFRLQCPALLWQQIGPPTVPSMTECRAVTLASHSDPRQGRRSTIWKNKKEFKSYIFWT